MNFPKIKNFLQPIIIDPDTVRFGGFQNGLSRDVKIEGGANLLFDLLKSMDGKISYTDLVSSFSKNKNIDSKDVELVIEILCNNGLLIEAYPDNSSFSLEEIERYDRNVKFYASLDTSSESNHWTYQERLKKSRVAILGLGGIGSNVALSLVASGVGYIKMIDCDEIESSNLTRQVLYNESDIGQSKTQRAKKNLENLNKFVDIEILDKRIETEEDIIKFIKDVDILIMAADEPRDLINYIADSACRSVGIPWILGSYASTSINCMTFSNSTPCFTCFMHYHKNQNFYDKYKATEEIFPSSHASIAPVASIPAQLVAFEAIRILTNLGSVFSDKVYQINMKNLNLEIFERKYSQSCSCRRKD